MNVSLILRTIYKTSYDKFPILRPFIQYVKKILTSFRNLYLNRQRLFEPPPRFSGWGMTSNSELPWVDKYKWKGFWQNCQDVKRNFIHGLESDTGINSGNIDTLLWRHWIVSFCVRYAIEFNNERTNELNLVECGVGDGVSAFFALRESQDYKKNNKDVKFYMHLYDSWASMREQGLRKTELINIGRYRDSSLQRTKHNLAEFSNNIIYHEGYIPESLNILPCPPDSLIYLHIDLNSAIPTLEALKFFYPKLTKGGVILFDDYGWIAYSDTKEVIDDFFVDKPGVLMKLPTGQAIYFIKS